MSERCKSCERYEKRLKGLRERRENLWRRGELTDVADKKVAADEQHVAEELEQHRIAQLGDARLQKQQRPQQKRTRISKKRSAAMRMNCTEERGRQHGHDLDDWLHAEAEITAEKSRTAVA